MTKSDNQTKILSKYEEIKECLRLEEKNSLAYKERCIESSRKLVNGLISFLDIPEGLLSYVPILEEVIQETEGDCFKVDFKNPKELEKVFYPREEKIFEFAIALEVPLTTEKLTRKGEYLFDVKGNHTGVAVKYLFALDMKVREVEGIFEVELADTLKRTLKCDSDFQEFYENIFKILLNKEGSKRNKIGFCRTE